MLRNTKSFLNLQRDGVRRIQDLVATAKKTRTAMYFTFLDYAPKFHRMIYTTNWIKRLNRSYKRTLSMRGAMPSASSVLFLLGSVAMEMTKTTYFYSVSLFEDWTSTKKKASTPSSFLQQWG